MTGTDSNNLSCSGYFTIYFQSKPYLNQSLTNWQIRTNQYFSYQIPPATFVDPNGYYITYSFQDIPSWMSLNYLAMTLFGTPNATQVGTYTIIVIGTDSKNESAQTSF